MDLLAQDFLPKRSAGWEWSRATVPLAFAIPVGGIAWSLWRARPRWGTGAATVPPSLNFSR